MKIAKQLAKVFQDRYPAAEVELFIAKSLVGEKIMLPLPITEATTEDTVWALSVKLGDASRLIRIEPSPSDTLNDWITRVRKDFFPRFDREAYLMRPESIQYRELLTALSIRIHGLYSCTIGPRLAIAGLPEPVPNGPWSLEIDDDHGRFAFVRWEGDIGFWLAYSRRPPNASPTVIALLKTRQQAEETLFAHFTGGDAK